jgi:hypothetical protein
LSEKKKTLQFCCRVLKEAGREANKIFRGLQKEIVELKIAPCPSAKIIFCLLYPTFFI